MDNDALDARDLQRAIGIARQNLRRLTVHSIRNLFDRLNIALNGKLNQLLGDEVELLGGRAVGIPSFAIEREHQRVPHELVGLAAFGG